MARLKTKKAGGKRDDSRLNKGNPNCKYQTIAATSSSYEGYKVMAEYNTLQEARDNYLNDMEEWKATQGHEDYHSFGIKELPKDE